MLLIDASPLIYRAFYSVPSMGKRPLNAVYGFIRSLMKLMREIEFNHLVVCMEGQHCFRRDLDSNYKSNRPPIPNDLFDQFPIVEEALTSFGLPWMKKEGFEADDLIASLARHADANGYQVVVISPDKDILQIVNTHIEVRIAGTDKAVDKVQIDQKFSVEPFQIPHLQALIGDPTDNIPRVPGLHVSNAKKLIQEFGTIDHLLQSLDRIQPQHLQDLIRQNIICIQRSYQLAKLVTDISFDEDFEAWRFKSIQFNSARSFCAKYSLKSITKTLNQIESMGGEDESQIRKKKKELKSNVLNRSSMPIHASHYSPHHSLSLGIEDKVEFEALERQRMNEIQDEIESKKCEKNVNSNEGLMLGENKLISSFPLRDNLIDQSNTYPNSMEKNENKARRIKSNLDSIHPEKMGASPIESHHHQDGMSGKKNLHQTNQKNLNTYHVSPYPFNERNSFEDQDLTSPPTRLPGSGRARLLKTLLRVDKEDDYQLNECDKKDDEVELGSFDSFSLESSLPTHAKPSIQVDNSKRRRVVTRSSQRSTEEVDIDSDPMVVVLTEKYDKIRSESNQQESKQPLESNQQVESNQPLGSKLPLKYKQLLNSKQPLEFNYSLNQSPPPSLQSTEPESKPYSSKSSSHNGLTRTRSEVIQSLDQLVSSTSTPISTPEEEDMEVSNLELVDFIKNRKAVEVDPDFVNLFHLCQTCADRRHLLHNKIKGVTVVNDAESAQLVIKKLFQLSDQIHACDTETVDLDLKIQGPIGHGRIICASIYCGPDFDFGNGPRIWIDNLTDRDTILLFKSYFESPSIQKVWHHYGFDCHILHNHGIECHGFSGDTMHMARLWDPSRRGAKAYSLEALARDLLVEESKIKVGMKQRFGRVKMKKDGTPSKSSVVLPLLDELQMDPEWLPEWIDYSTLDAEDTWKLRKVLQNKLDQQPWTIPTLNPASEKIEPNLDTSPLLTMWDFYKVNWLPFGELLTRMERRGIKIDRPYLDLLIPLAESQKAECESKFVSWAVDMVGPECRFMNAGSDAQKQQLLFAPCVNRLDPNLTLNASREFETLNVESFVIEGKKGPLKKRKFTINGLGLPFIETTTSGWPAVAHPVLKRLAGDPPNSYGSLQHLFRSKGLRGGREACEALAAVVDASQIDTLLTTFMRPLGGYLDANDRVHGSLNINTETGRLSSRRPNLQNQPAHEKDRFKLRKAFTCDAGHQLIVADYGQLELRLLAHMSQCQSMLDAFASGGDFHSRTALGMYKHVKEAVESGQVLLELGAIGSHPHANGSNPMPLLKDVFGTERRRAKTLNFSIAYGKTIQGLAKDWDVPIHEAKSTLEKWYADRPEVQLWQERTIDGAHRLGYTRTLLGRYRPLPDINSRVRTKRGHSERAAINTPLQGGAADITTRAMILLERNENLRKLGWVQLLQIHDELILEGPSESAEEARACIMEVMSNPLDRPLMVELVVDAKIASNWYDAK